MGSISQIMDMIPGISNIKSKIDTNDVGDEKFDLLISGINAGSNLGLDCVTSGTVGAAIIGSTYKIPSIAISVCAITNVNYSVASDIAIYFAKNIHHHKKTKIFSRNDVKMSYQKFFEGCTTKSKFYK